MADSNELTIESIESAMMMAISDSNETFAITMNGATYEFKYYFDSINKTSSRKMFTSPFWKFHTLYWYHPYGTSKTLICPLAFKTRTGEIKILYSIFETMCNRPRFDALTICLETSEVCIVRNITGLVSELLLNFPFDVDEMTGYTFYVFCTI